MREIGHVHAAHRPAVIATEPATITAHHVLTDAMDGEVIRLVADRAGFVNQRPTGVRRIEPARVTFAEMLHHFEQASFQRPLASLLADINANDG